MARKLQFKRGNKAKLPALAEGEPAVALDEGRLYFGGSSGNIKLPTSTELDGHTADAVKHITPAERTAWTGKAGTAVVTTTANGLMAAADKAKLDGIAAQANKTVIANNLTTTAAGSALDAVQGKILKDLTDGRISTEVGVHGLRYYQDVLSYYNGSAWIDIDTGSSGIIPGDMIEIALRSDNKQMKITFTEPNDSAWFGTKIVRKVGSFPTNIKDGVQILDNKVRNQYKNTPFNDSDLSNGTTYCYQFFPYSESGGMNLNGVNRAEGIPQLFKTMTVKIDLENSNPSTCTTYADDAAGMTPGSAEWDKFFGHRPCLFKDGKVVGYLNPNDFTKFENGTAADITSGNAGDVMIEFPRRGLKITTVGNLLIVSMTDAPDHPDFEYYAHQRGMTKKTNFYLGAFKGVQESSKLRSLSGKTPTLSQSMNMFRTQAQANGSGYDQSGFYQLVFRQSMYLLKYKNLNSQTAVGRGYVDGNTAAINTGGTETRGMDFGETTGKQHMKLFGLEDFWGNVWEWIDGIATDASWNMYTNTSNFQDDGRGSGYIDNGPGVNTDKIGFMSKPQGKTETGYITKEVSGSETTYFSDYTQLRAGRVASFGGSIKDGSTAGVFVLRISVTFSASSDTGGRLMYL